MSPRFPMPPGVVGRVLRTAADPECCPRELGRLLETDAVLTAQVLRAVNSATYGLRHKVASVDRAVTLMGTRAVRNMVLTLCLRDLVPTASIAGFPLDSFWESSLRRAAAARCIAERLGLENPDEHFTIGLCQDLGLLIHLAAEPALVGRLGAIAGEPSDDRFVVERATGSSHDEISAAMFGEWGLPDGLVQPVRFHHSPEDAPEPHRTGAQVAHGCEALADLSLVTDKRRAIDRVHERLAAVGLPEETAKEILERVNDLVSEFAELIGLDVAEQPTYEEIVAIATTGLLEMDCSFEEVGRRLQAALVEQQRMTAELERINRELERQAHTDNLTGLPNRRAFDESLLRELAVAQRQRARLSLVLFDVDWFKTINDRHGHAAGDQVLAAIGGIVRRMIRLSDSAGRLGGEEFGLILPFTDEVGARCAAERYRAAVAAASIVVDGEPLRCTASFGVTTVESVDDVSPTGAAHLLRVADAALYDAKRAGRDRVAWRPFPAAATEVTARS